jgi:tetratricopeptide (TPR) repeat protein
MWHDDPDRLAARKPDDDTRSLAGAARSEASRQAADEETRQLDVAGPIESYDPSSHQASVTELGSGAERAVEDSMVGRRIGRFVVLGTLGRGGMGTVYEAFDRTLDRTVAVKILHPDVTGLDQKRLIREAQALAQLSHPNVVQVYEAGELGGQSFVAMELVQGRTLRRWLGQEPRPGWRACVEIYMQAGAGLAAAHDKGLVHCDFKPSNAIVDDKGRVRVLDFGLARAARELALDSRVPATKRRVDEPANRTWSSETAAVMGTPAYMPLEQMKGEEVDARGDQFSFCVALYEAVYGHRPFEGQSLGELREAREAERIVAAPRNTKVPAKLREILVRGLAADPERRWRSMQALLDQLRPLYAPRRRRNLLVLSGALALGGALAGAGLAYQAHMGRPCSGAQTQLDGVWDDARRQQLEEAILGTGLSYAPDTWERVVTPLDEYASAWVDMHTEVCEATSVRKEQSAAVMDLRMGCLREHRVALREVVDVLAQAEATRVMQAVTLVASLPALSQCDDVEGLQAELPPPEDPQVAAQVEALRDGLVQVRALHNAGAYDEALAAAEAIVAQADGLGHAPLQAEALLERGLARQDKAQYEEAERDLERAYLLAVELEHSEVAAAAVRELAIVVGHDQAEHEAGLQWSKTAVALARRPRADPREEAAALSAIGVMLLGKGELDEALAHQQRALTLFEDALGPDQPDIADLLLNMGNVLRQQGKLDEALSCLQRALAIREKALGPHHPDVAGPLTTLGAALDERGQRQEALMHLQRALAIREEALGAGHPDVATSLNNIGIMYKGQGQLPEALAHFQRALAILEASLGPTHPRLAYPLNNIGEVLRAQDEQERALGYYQRALAVLEQSQGSDHPNVASSMINLGNLLYEQERYEEAEPHYRRALEIQRRTLPEDHPHQAWPLLGLAKIDLDRGSLQRAREHAEQAVSIREKAKVAPVLLAEGRFVLARILWNDHPERSRARDLAEQARDGWSSAGGDDPQTKEYLSEVEQWLAEHPMRP